MNVVIIAVLAAVFIGELLLLARWPEGYAMTRRLRRMLRRLRRSLRPWFTALNTFEWIAVVISAIFASFVIGRYDEATGTKAIRRHRHAR